MPVIDTGYKPEFSLGALYQGMNGANANMLAQEDLLKQFLANQQSIQTNPIDVQQKLQNLASTEYKTNPAYQQGMTDMISGQGMSNLAAGKTAQGLQQFKEAAERAKAQQEAGQANLFTQMFGSLGKQYDRTLPENERAAAGENAYALADTLSRVDPKIMAQERMLGMKLDSNEYIKEMDAESKAKLKAAAVQGDKTSQQALVSYWKKQLDLGLIDSNQYVQEIANLQNAILAAKVQPGIQVNPAIAPEVLQQKPQQQQYVPGAGSSKMSDSDLINKYLK